MKQNLSLDEENEINWKDDVPCFGKDYACSKKCYNLVI
jgi:hypothetical protein